MASTGITPRESDAFRRGSLNGKQLSAREREDMVKRFLPNEPESPSTPTSKSSHNWRPTSPANKDHQRRKTGFFRHFLHLLIYTIVSALFSVYFRFRRSYRLVRSRIVSVLYHHHRTPEFIQRDVRQLERLPNHLSVILDFNESDEDQGEAGLEGLLNNVCEIAAWSASAGIPFLSVYERTGMHLAYL
ncbi:hypothetical protein CC78DRAFT_528337 [Lojkania enalia]|uniref:ditrans,polycis-polyprenyl diphosphate synthase [(2E,6E)-farnesyldiphosphate specific] n=1 Tax=Lojkania enalia TaxID=147567 RepID=A0A9P4TR42_9PLEO|nr:hypothetical protein CC78DRAFT_528337 [Didymosphaeria enalia]